MSLASFAALMITAVRMSEGHYDLPGITHVRWETDYGESEESSVEDLIHWLNTGSGRAYVQRPDGTRGARIHVARSATHVYLRSEVDADDDSMDGLLSLPRLDAARAHRPTHRRRFWRSIAL